MKLVKQARSWSEPERELDKGAGMGLNFIFDWVYAHIGQVFTTLSAIVAISSALAARAETRKQRELRTEQLRASIDAASLDWGNAAIDTLVRTAAFARTRHLQQNDTSFQTGKTNLLVNLSALVERGRMFFPNLNEDRKGAEKEGAYRGHRPPVLDALMWAYYELEALSRDGGPTGDNSAEFFEECRRLMVSELQAHLDPRRLNQIVGRYDAQPRDHQTDAISRARDLKAKLLSRRPGLSIEGVQATQIPTETRQ